MVFWLMVSQNKQNVYIKLGSENIAWTFVFNDSLKTVPLIIKIFKRLVIFLSFFASSDGPAGCRPQQKKLNKREGNAT